MTYSIHNATTTVTDQSHIKLFMAIIQINLG